MKQVRPVLSEICCATDLQQRNVALNMDLRKIQILTLNLVEQCAWPFTEMCYVCRSPGDLILLLAVRMNR